MEVHVNDHANELPHSKDVQELLRAMRNHQEGEELSYPGQLKWGSNFLTFDYQIHG